MLNDFSVFVILHWTYNVHTLQKQIGCFSHRVVILVAVKLKDSGYERFTLVLQLHKATREAAALIMQTGDSLTLKC